MNEEIILIGKEKVEGNTIGDMIRKPIERKIFGEEKQVYSSTFFQAAAVGMKAEKILVIWKFDYKEEKYLIYKGIKYEILKIYETEEEKLEITCTSDIKKKEVNAYGNS